ncbi:zf-HC2 domain-containing protein [Streptomyces sp. NPDC086549]|uniref:zf-HC2 domain-containing protein n=1 Tax=Streptomyces sp. NPDC086549 TaxID=3365752 RepID=UPI0037F217B0
MSSEVTCERLREIGPELALGVLPGRERAGAVVHLDGCAGCREYIEQLTLVGDGLIGLLPGSEPPVGFEARVAQTLMQRAPGHEGHRQVHGHAVFRKHPRGWARLRLASAAAALVAAVGFGGWVVGTAVENVAAGPSPVSVGTGAEMLSGDLTSAVAKGKPIGDVYAHGNPEGWVYMTVDLAQVGNPYNGKVICLLERKDGTTFPVSTFTLRNGSGSWGAPASVDLLATSGARVTKPDGTVLATARLEEESGGRTTTGPSS